MSHSLQRLCHYLRGLLKTMAGETYDPYQNIDLDYDGLGFDAVDLQELTNLLESLDEHGGGYPDSEGRQDWATERESEISRLEKENEELRKMLGIDEANMNAHGLTVDPDRVETGRFSTFLSNSRRGPSEPYNSRSSYWENNGQQPGGGVGVGVSGGPSGGGGGVQQRVMDLQPGMRAGPQARRTGIFGAGQQRGGFMGGVVRGPQPSVSVGGMPNNSVWGIQPTTPVPLSERPWQIPGGSSGLDLNR
jgi:hypothetical protein